MDQLAPLRRARCPFKSDRIPWAETIFEYLDGESLANLAMTCRWLEQEMMNDSVWKFACLRGLKVHDPEVPMGFTWRQLYASVFCKTRALQLDTNKDKVLDRKIIGGFLFESPVAMVIGDDTLESPVAMVIGEDTLESSQKLLSGGYCELNNIRIGIWTADLKNIKTISEEECVIFEARHVELLLTEAYMHGEWMYEELGYIHVSNHAKAAPFGIFDYEHIRDTSTSEVFDLDSWAGKQKIKEIDYCTCLHGAAININFAPNDGSKAIISVVRDGDGDVVAIQIKLQVKEKYYYQH